MQAQTVTILLLSMMNVSIQRNEKFASDAKQEVTNLKRIHFAIPTEIKETVCIFSKGHHWVYFYYDIVTRKSVYGDSLGFSLLTNLLRVMPPIFHELSREDYKFCQLKPELMHIPCNEEIHICGTACALFRQARLLVELYQ